MIKRVLAFMALPILLFAIPSVVGVVWGAEVFSMVLGIFIVAFLAIYLFFLFGLLSYDIFLGEDK